MSVVVKKLEYKGFTIVIRRVNGGGYRHYIKRVVSDLTWKRQADCIADAKKCITYIWSRLSRERMYHNETLIEDGFGGCWRKCDREDCGLFVVRPGKVDCGVCDLSAPKEGES